MNTTESQATNTKWFEKASFSGYDYAVFSAMLLVSTLIGVYFGLFEKQSTVKDYLLGGKKMHVLPIGMSLIASHVSSVTLLAVPADVYKYGSMYWLSVVSITIVCFIVSTVTLPVFYNLQLTSTFEYLEMRFDTRVRLLASVLTIISFFLYMPLVIYIPSLAFSQATGINTFSIAIVVMAICIFYTTIGGLKAVVWTDTLQFTITILSMLIVFVKGLISVEGFENVFKTSREGGRLDFDFDLDITKRETVMAVTIGWIINYTRMIGTGQDCIQKFLALPTLNKALQATAVCCVGLIVVKTACVLTGLIIYTKYAGCDPFSAGFIDKPDQLLPYFVIDVASNIPGLSGLFIASVFCAALSTMSAMLNALSGVVYKDFFSKIVTRQFSEKTISNILKIIVVILGTVCTLLVLIVRHLGGVLPLAISACSATSGTALALFLIGMVLPKVNAKGIFYGTIISLKVVVWIFFGAQWYKAQGLLHYPTKGISTELCPMDSPKNTTVCMSTTPEQNEVFFVYRISYYYYALIGIVISVIASCLISWLIKEKDGKEIDKKLLSPIIYCLLNERSTEYSTVNQALNKINC